MTKRSDVRRYVNQLGEHEEIDQIFLVREKQLRPNRQGNLYLQLRLCDRTGSLTGMLWNATEAHYAGLEGGGYVRVRGTTQIYNGQLQMMLKQVQPVVATEVNEADFRALGSADLEIYAHQVRQRLAAIEDQELRQLMQILLDSPNLFTKFCQAPAALRHHHAYEGGLLQHVAQLMQLADRVCQSYPQLNRDLLAAGVFLHDLGKIEELQWDPESAYTDAGQLIGHPVLGVCLLDRASLQYEQVHGKPVRPPLLYQLQHMIVSHHGKLEFGSPKVPMTLEALTLSYLDDLDAKLHQFQQLMAADLNADSRWTIYHAHLGRKLFKGPTDAQTP